MTTITALTIEAADATVAEKFYRDAFGFGPEISVIKSESATAGFRGAVISLLVTQPANATLLFDAAVAAGASVIKPLEKSIWGFGGTLQAPDGTLWKVATSAKKDTTPPAKTVNSIVVLIAASDVAASKKFYVEKGLKVGKSFGKYVEFDLSASPIKFGLYTTKALAKDAGVAPEGTGSHRIEFAGDLGTFTDPDGFVWANA